MTTFLGIVISIVAFAVMVFIHEFGHFITAKLFNVRVNKFALGMGPALFKFGKKETEYSLRLFPIGGYCAMEGEDSESENPRAFNNQKAWKRLIILAAGAIMNILLGLLITSILVSQMSLLGTRRVAVNADEAAESAFEDFDEILSVNGKHIFTATDIDYILALDNDGKADFLVKRNGEKIKLDDVQLDLITDESSGATGTSRDFALYGNKKSFFRVIGYSVMSTFSTVRLVLYSFASLVTGKVPVTQISGPVAVTSTVVKTVSGGWKTVLNLIALISINLGVFNLFPIPALDGSRMVFVLIEMIRRKPIKPKHEAWVHTAGFVLLIGLMIFVFFNDIYSLFR